MPAARVCLFVNPAAGSAAQLDALRHRLADVTVCELARGDDLTQLARRAAEDGFDVVAVAGGDGTVHAAAAGLLTASRPATLAVLPHGTGNDFCRTIGVPLDPLAAADLLTTGTPRALDAVKIEGAPSPFLVNVATGGFSGQVAAEVTPELKATWGPLAYLRGAIGTAVNPLTFRLAVRFDGGRVKEFDVINVVVANARTAAGGFPVAPTADPEDGLLDVVFVRAGDALDLGVVAARLMHGDYTHDENVAHFRARAVEIASDPPLPWSLDGERCEGARLTFTVLPGALRVLTGPDYRRTPAPDAPLEAEDAPEHPTRPDPGLAARGFGLLGAALLLVKRTPGWAAAGLALAAGAAIAFAWLARGVVGHEWRAWDERVMHAQHAAASPARDALAASLTWLGDATGTAAVTLAVVGVFLWRKHYLSAAAFLAVLAGVLVLEFTLKPLFGLARPDLFPWKVEVGGFSFPSGHALRGVGMFGFLAAVAACRAWCRRSGAWAVAGVVCVGVAGGVCWSRVYVGVHRPTDVIAGALAAAAWVVTCLLAREYAATRPRRNNTAAGAG